MYIMDLALVFGRGGPGGTAYDVLVTRSDSTYVSIVIWVDSECLDTLCGGSDHIY